MGRGGRGAGWMGGRVVWGRGWRIPCGVATAAPGAGRVRRRGSRGLFRSFRARRPSGPAARWRFAGLAGRGRGS